MNGRAMNLLIATAVACLTAAASENLRADEGEANYGRPAVQVPPWPVYPGTAPYYPGYDPSAEDSQAEAHAAPPATVPPAAAPGVTYAIPQPVGSYMPTWPDRRYVWSVTGRYRITPDGATRYRVRSWWEDGYYRISPSKPRFVR
jgi:hypothetical protein